MIDSRRQLIRAHLELIAARLEDERARQQIKRYCVAHDRVSTATVHHVWNGQDHKISTLITIADALGCDVVIDIRKRVA